MEKTKRLHLIIFALCSLLYFSWRIVFSLPFRDSVLSMILAIILLVTEIIGCFELIAHLALSSFSVKRKKLENLKGVPDVDILVPTKGEDISLLEETIKACTEIRWPKEKKHIHLCDDAEREEVRELAEKYGAVYIARPEHDHAKAGNLNYALQHTDSPLVAVFDADMCPRPEFLEKTVPYMLGGYGKRGEREIDPQAGFVQTPQCFRYEDLFQKAFGGAGLLPNEQDYFYYSVEPSREHVNAVFMAGTNMLISRRALQDAGLFQTDTLTEDFATGIQIQKKGYQGYDLTEDLAFGEVPEDLPTLIRQRRRWACGCIQTPKVTRILRSKELSLKQKICYFLAILYWYFPVKRLLYLAGPVLFACFGFKVMRCDWRELCVFWIPYYLLSCHEIRYFSGNTRTAHLSAVYEMCLTPFLLLPVLGESIGLRHKVFEVTGRSGGKKWRSVYLLPFVLLILVHVWSIAMCVMNHLSPEYAFLFIWLIYNLYVCLKAFRFVLSCRRIRMVPVEHPKHILGGSFIG